MSYALDIFIFILIIYFFNGPLYRIIRFKMIDMREDRAMQATASISNYVEKYGLNACYVDSSNADYRMNKNKLAPASRKAVNALEDFQFNTKQYIFYITDPETKELFAKCYCGQDGQLLKYKIKLSPKTS